MARTVLSTCRCAIIPAALLSATACLFDDVTLPALEPVARGNEFQEREGP